MTDCGCPGSDGPIMHPMGPFAVERRRTNMVPMRDGVRLSTDLYFPKGAEGPYGTILERTPYNKNKGFPDTEGFSKARFFASYGFVFAAQDKRGKFESEGAYRTMYDDVDDGSDTIDWIARQDWSNGRVGMIGCSYGGATQIKAAQSLNPHLAAIIPQSAGTAHGSADGRYSFMWTRGGVVNISMALWCYIAGAKEFKRPPAGLSDEQLRDWFAHNDPAEGHPDAAELHRDPARAQAAMLTLPVVDILKAVGECPPTDWEMLTNAPSHEWWAGTQCLTEESRFDVPALHINGWQDYGVAESFLQFNRFRERSETALGRDNQYIIVGPATHCAVDRACSSRTDLGDYDAGDARFDFWGAYLAWFDRWLNGNEDAWRDVPRIRYYTTGVNAWRTAAQWPLPDVEPTPFYLASGPAGANSRFGAGRLILGEPACPGHLDEYVHDPACPVSSISTLKPFRDLSPWEGRFDRREIESRHDVLVYTSEALTAPLEVTGPMEAVLFVSSSAVDTDFDVTLVDLHPDGRAIGLYDGVLRARYRNGFDRSELMTPEEIYELRIDLNVISHTFLEGHCIRVEIASSNFPNHDRNLGTGGNNATGTEWVTAVNRIHLGPEHPSRIVLPVRTGRDRQAR